MVRSVSDAAIVLSIIAGPDPNDNFTLAQPTPVPDFTKALHANALKGKRIGVPRRVFLNDSITGNDPFVNVVFEQALEKCPPKSCKPIFLMYANLEEDYGLAKRAMAIYDRATKEVEDGDKFEVS